MGERLRDSQPPPWAREAGVRERARSAGLSAPSLLPALEPGDHTEIGRISTKRNLRPKPKHSQYGLQLAQTEEKPKVLSRALSRPPLRGDPLSG